jgi:hypothetical protein
MPTGTSDAVQLITVQDHTSSGTLTEAEFNDLVEGLALQAENDYNTSPWVTGGLATAIEVHALKRKAKPPKDAWHIELLDTSDQEGALGYHDDEAFKRGTPGTKPEKASTHSSRGLSAATLTPLSKVFVKTAREDGADPAEVASHEMLEMTVDPNVVGQPRTVLHRAKKQVVIVEVGDPVQGCGYKSGNVTVADFAEPAWFGYPQEGSPKQFSYCSSVDHAFKLAPQGYISVAPEGEPENWSQVFGSPH